MPFCVCHAALARVRLHWIDLSSFMGGLQGLTASDEKLFEMANLVERVAAAAGYRCALTFLNPSVRSPTFVLTCAVCAVSGRPGHVHSRTGTSAETSAHLTARGAGAQRRADGPGAIAERLEAALAPHDWGFLRLVWPPWLEKSDVPARVFAEFAALATRDAGRYVHTSMKHGPLVIVGWGSGATTALEAAARLRWELGTGAVEVVVALTEPNPMFGLQLGGGFTLDAAVKSLQHSLGVLTTVMGGAEAYCPHDTYSLGRTMQVQAHVSGVVQLIMAAVQQRTKHAEGGNFATKVMTARAAARFLRPVRQKVKSEKLGVHDLDVGRWPGEDGLDRGERRPQCVVLRTVALLVPGY